jgi:hypothetical protein
MVIDGAVTLTGSMNWTRGAARNSEDLNFGVLPGSRGGIRGPLARAPRHLLALQSARRLVPGRVGDIVATGRLRRLFWRAADDLDYL